MPAATKLGKKKNFRKMSEHPMHPSADWNQFYQEVSSGIEQLLELEMTQEIMAGTCGVPLNQWAPRNYF